MHLAQINVARMLAPLDSERMREFREFIAPINALADHSPGFRWRYREDPTDPPFGDDDLMIVNLSVWESAAALREFTYHTVHSYFVRKRKHWFSGLDHPHLACWWVPPGTQPSVAEARDRLERLRREGIGPDAFPLSHVVAPD